VKPESKDYLAAAHRHLGYARTNLSPANAPVAAREAYMGAFHAALALIFERTGKPTKTHNGAQSRFHELIRGEPTFPQGLRAFLSTGFALKSSADYSSTELPTLDQANAATREATAFVAAIEAILAR